MSKYFYQCNYHLIDRSLRSSLLHLVTTATDFYQHISPTGKFDGNNIKRVPLDSFPAIADMVSACQFETVALIYKHMPRVEVPKHTDGLKFSVPRRTTLIIPLSPNTEYASTYFWESYESTEPAAVVSIDENMFPYVITTQEIHSVSNSSDNIRANLQFSFNETLEEVVEQVKNRTLFKGFVYE